jgi:putative ABC transport system permease protein
MLAALRYRTPLGWRQLSAKPLRLCVALAGVMFANVLMFMQFGVLTALIETSVMLQQRLVGDIVLSSSTGRQLLNIGTIPRRRAMQALAIPGVADASEVYSGMVEWINPATGKGSQLMVLGVDPQAQVFSMPEIDALRGKLMLPNAALLDRRSRGDWSGIVAAVESLGTFRTELSGRQVHIEGLFSMGAAFASDGTLIVSRETFLTFAAARSAGAVSFVLVKIEPGADAPSVARQLRASLPEADVKVETMAEFVATHRKFLAKDSPISFIFTMGALVGLVVGAGIVYQILSGDVNEHLAEYATLKALGYSHGHLLSVVFEQSLVLAIFGYIPSVIVAALLFKGISVATFLPIALTGDRMLLVFALTFGMCVVSGALATLRLRAADPADVF